MLALSTTHCKYRQSVLCQTKLVKMWTILALGLMMHGSTHKIHLLAVIGDIMTRRWLPSQTWQLLIITVIIIKRQFVRRRNMSVDITSAPYRQSGNVVRDS